MIRTVLVSSSLAVGLALAGSAPALAQAGPRSRSSEPAASTSSAPAAASRTQGDEGAQTSPSRGRVSPREAPRQGTARPRTDPEPGGIVGGPAAGTSAPDSQRGRSAPATADDSRGGRARNGRPIEGTAEPRRGGRPVSFPFFGPWGYWYPWYGSGLGSHLGVVAYDPWRYGGTPWVWSRYGLWYDPYSYYSYVPYVHPYYGRREVERRDSRALEGSIRLRVNPREARVFIDGALVGIVDDFDGLTQRLRLEAGTYELEIRADGYETYTGELLVTAGTTRTTRVTLKKR